MSDYEYNNDHDRIPFEEEDNEKLHKLLVLKFNESKVKDCVDLNDYDHIEETKTFHENGKNDKLDEHDEYKILLKSMSGNLLRGRVTTLYIPRYIDVIYLNEMYKINLETHEVYDIENLLESSKYALENLLDHSKEVSSRKTFNDKYKKVILVVPYFPENSCSISFDKLDLFYYETIIRDIDHTYETTINPRKWIEFNDEMYERGNLTFWVNYVNEYVRFNYIEDDDENAEFSDITLIPRKDKLHKFNLDYDYDLDVSTGNRKVLDALRIGIRHNNASIMYMYIKHKTEYDRLVIDTNYTLDRYQLSCQTDLLLDALKPSPNVI